MNRFIIRASRSPFWTKLARPTPRVDLFVHRITRGRILMSRMLGFPTIVLAHTGRVSKQERRTPMSPVEVNDGWAVGDANWGLHRRPDWSRNLAADPDAVVETRGTRTPVRARRCNDRERAGLRDRFIEQWPVVVNYEQRCGREIWYWVLEPRTLGG